MFFFHCIPFSETFPGSPFGPTGPIWIEKKNKANDLESLTIAYVTFKLVLHKNLPGKPISPFSPSRPGTPFKPGKPAGPVFPLSPAGPRNPGLPIFINWEKQRKEIFIQFVGNNNRCNR